MPIGIFSFVYCSLLFHDFITVLKIVICWIKNQKKFWTNVRVVNFSSCFCVFIFFAWRFFFGWRCQLLRPWSALFFGSWLTRIPSENILLTSYCILHFVFILVFFVCFYLFFLQSTNHKFKVIMKSMNTRHNRQKEISLRAHKINSNWA